MTTISNVVFTVLSQKLCWKMNMLHMLIGTPRAASSNLFFYKAGFKSDIYTNLFLYNKILFKNLRCILLISEGFFFFVLFFSKYKAGDLWAREFYGYYFYFTSL